MERPLPGYEGYVVGYDDDQVWCKSPGGTVLANNQPKRSNHIMWRIRRNGVPTMLAADDCMLSAFPEIDPGEYIYTLYRGVKNRPTTCGYKRKIEITEDILLEILILPTTYCLTLPIQYNIGKSIKKLFPGPLIDIPCEYKGSCWREIYFRSDEHMVCVKKKLQDFLKNSGHFQKT